jgi:LDH2 family malate/lactate/ureidoglycolate dehydrogenase
MGQVVSFHAMNIAIEKAKDFGISGIGVYNSNHNGSEAYFAMMALPFNMIGYCLTVGGVNHMAPYGGRDKVLGNNPFAIAVPTGKDFPIVLDMACSVVARGWISLAMQEGRKIPEGWALDRNGNPTTNAKEAYEGTVLPIGEYKGFNLSLIIGIISAVLTGGAIGKDVTNLYENFVEKQNIGHFMGAINISYFSTIEQFKQRIDNLVNFIKSSRTIKGMDRIYLPGEKEYETKNINLKKGLPIASSVIKEFKNLAEKYNIDFDYK